MHNTGKPAVPLTEFSVHFSLLRMLFIKVTEHLIPKFTMKKPMKTCHAMLICLAVLVLTILGHREDFEMFPMGLEMAH